MIRTVFRDEDGREAILALIVIAERTAKANTTIIRS